MRRLSLFYVALVAMVLTSGCATTRRKTEFTADQLRSLGEKALIAHDAAASLKFLTMAEKKLPNDAVIQYDLGLAYNERGFDTQAFEHVQKALKIKPDYPEALNTLGFMYATRGQFDLARQAFEKSMNDPFYQTPQIPAFNLGQIYQKRGDNQTALFYYRKAVKLNSHYAEAWYQIGKILEQTGSNDEARQAYQTAVQESPEMAEAFLQLGIMSFRAHKIREAAGFFSQVERVAPNSASATKAQGYLDRINSPRPAVLPHHYLPSRLKSQNMESPQETAPVATPAPKRTITPPAPTTKGENENAATKATTTTPAAPASSFRYVVKIGSFSDRQKAEEMKSKLGGKGYDAIVTHTRGGNFLVELKPVASFSKAATLKAQVAGQTSDSPTIIKIRAH